MFAIMHQVWEKCNRAQTMKVWLLPSSLHSKIVLLAFSVARPNEMCYKKMADENHINIASKNISKDNALNIVHCNTKLV